jgi:hypothetical protein
LFSLDKGVGGGVTEYKACLISSKKLCPILDKPTTYFHRNFTQKSLFPILPIQKKALDTHRSSSILNNKYYFYFLRQEKLPIFYGKNDNLDFLAEIRQSLWILRFCPKVILRTLINCQWFFQWIGLFALYFPYFQLDLHIVQRYCPWIFSDW